MRQNLLHSGSDHLSYEIRGIVDFAKLIENLGVEIFWENIGDPIAKGEKIPSWIKSEIKNLLDDDSNWGYSPTKGLTSTREFIANSENLKNNSNLNKDDIIFFNGLGDAISTIYSLLKKEVRIMGPSPAYPTHSSAEAANSNYEQVTYNLNHVGGWRTDMVDLISKVKYNKMIVGILIINPDNPTGMVYREENLKKIVKIAKEYNLFIISDEIYSNLVYNDANFIPISSILDGVPAIVMRGISKDLPWPGSRCGWIEVYNKESDENFTKFVKSIVDSKMLEVCSTTLPQAAIPKLYSSENYKKYLNSRIFEIERRANFVYETLKDVRGIVVNKTYGAFYTSIVFEKNVLNLNQNLEISNLKIKNLVEKYLTLTKIDLDKRFVYYLLGSTGICTVPLTSFGTKLEGFRITLLEGDFEKFKLIFEIIKLKIVEFLNSN